MQRGLLLGAGAIILIGGGALALRAISHHEVTGQSEQKVDHALAELLAGASVTHGPIVEDGLTGTATVHDLVVARPDGASWTAATMVLSGVHAAALRDVFDPANYPNGHPAWTDRRKLLGDVTVTKIHLNVTGDQPGELTIGKAELHGLRGRPFSAPPTQANRAQPGFASDAALAFAYDSEQVTDLALSLQGPNPFKMTAASAGGTGYDAGKIESLGAKSLFLDGTTGPKHTPLHLAVTSLGLKGADASGLLASLHPGPAAASKVTFTYGSADGAGMTLQVTPGPSVTVVGFHAEQHAPDAGGVAEGSARLDGMTIGLGSAVITPSAAADIAAFGMNAITLDISASSRGKTGGATDFQDDFSLHDLGTLHMTGTVSGFAQPAGGGPGAALGALMGTMIEKATLVWDDHSLTNRIFKVVAGQAHATPEQIKAQLALPLVALGVLLPEQPDAADQVTHFLNDPHRLTVTFAPPEKVSLGQVAQAPATQRAQLLGVHISSQ